VEPIGSFRGEDESEERGAGADPIDRWDPELRLRAIAHDMATPTATVRLLAELVAARAAKRAPPPGLGWGSWPA